MPKRTYAERALDEATLKRFKDQLLVTFARRLSPNGVGEFRIPVREVGANGSFVFSFECDQANREFVFTVERKQ